MRPPSGIRTNQNGDLFMTCKINLPVFKNTKPMHWSDGLTQGDLILQVMKTNIEINGSVKMVTNDK